MRLTILSLVVLACSCSRSVPQTDNESCSLPSVTLVSAEPQADEGNQQVCENLGIMTAAACSAGYQVSGGSPDKKSASYLYMKSACLAAAIGSYKTCMIKGTNAFSGKTPTACGDIAFFVTENIVKGCAETLAKGPRTAKRTKLSKACSNKWATSAGADWKTWCDSKVVEQKKSPDGQPGPTLLPGDSRSTEI
jgi:hypothetical protein